MQRPDDELIDAELRRAFTPPPAVHFGEAARLVAAAPAMRRPRWRWFVAAAAAVLVAMLGMQRPQRGPEGHDGQQLAALWTAAFEHALDSGFGGAGCCAGDPDLAALCQAWCGARLAFGGDDDARLLGCYSGLSTGGCPALLLQVRGDPVCVFVVPRGHDPRPSLPPSASMTLASRPRAARAVFARARRGRRRAARLLGAAVLIAAGASGRRGQLPGWNTKARPNAAVSVVPSAYSNVVLVGPIE